MRIELITPKNSVGMVVVAIHASSESERLFLEGVKNAGTWPGVTDREPSIYCANPPHYGEPSNQPHGQMTSVPVHLHNPSAPCGVPGHNAP